MVRIAHALLQDGNHVLMIFSAIEWVTRLNALVKYWCRRHIVDARVETDIVHFSGKQHSMTIRPRDGAGRKPVLPNPEAGTSSMSLFWSWCVLDNCRPIIKAGQLYTKSEPRKHYKYVHLPLQWRADSRRFVTTDTHLWF